MTRRAASSLLGSLLVGESVRLTTDGKAHEVTVLTGLERQDGGGFGSWDHAAVRVGYGWGRWCVMVTPASLEDGRYSLERVA